MGLSGQILVLKLGDISFEQLFKDRILNVLGMNDSKIRLGRKVSAVIPLLKMDS